jgi:transporter family protein
MIYIAIFALIARILLLGYERIVFKQAGQDQDTLASTFWLFFLAALLQLPLLFFFPWTWNDFLRAAPSALIYTITFSLYVYALTHYEVSLITPLYNFNVFFLLLLFVIFRGEPFYWFKLIGIGFLFYGTTYLNKQQNLIASFKAIFSNRGCQMMIISSFLMAIGRLLDRNMIEQTDPAIYSFALYFLMGVYLILILIIRKKVTRTWKTFYNNPKPFLLGGFTNAYSYLFLLIAFLAIDVSIAEPLSMLSVIVSILLSAWIFHEKVRQRLVGAIFMVIGAILLLIKI